MSTKATFAIVLGILTIFFIEVFMVLYAEQGRLVM
jgi:hypothetical protein